MKTLHVTNNYPSKLNPVFGIFVKEQIESLRKQNIECDVFFINGREKGIKEYLISIFKLRNFLKNNKYDAIHCHHSLSALCLIFTFNFHKNIITSFQNDPINEMKIFFNLIKFFSNHLIFKNNSKLIQGTNSHYVPNGVNLNFFKPIDRALACEKLGLDSSKIYILFVSSNFIRKQKRYDIFIKVLKILKEKYSLNDIEKLVLTNTKRELVPYYFNASSLHLLTSDFEGSPNSVKEALSCNIPVVSKSVGNVNELLKDVDGSYVSKNNDVNSLVKLVLIVLKNKVRNNGRLMIKKNLLDMNSISKKIKKIYFNS